MILQARLDAAHAEAHVARLRRNFEQLQQTTEVRISPAIEDHEPGIDCKASLADRHVHGVSMPTGVAVSLEDGHIVLRRQQPRGEAAADPSANNCDSHGYALFSTAVRVGTSTRAGTGFKSHTNPIHDMATSR